MVALLVAVCMHPSHSHQEEAELHAGVKDATADLVVVAGHVDYWQGGDRGDGRRQLLTQEDGAVHGQRLGRG